jgi:two-component system clock-associated histidine kinase SasA
MQAAFEKLTYSEASLQLLLFVDQRPSAQKQIEQICSCLESLKEDFPFELEVVDVGQQPYLAEHFKIVATPTLIKVYPEPKHTLAGTNLVAQLQTWLPRWQTSAADYWESVKSQTESPETTTEKLGKVNSLAYATEIIQLSDEIFRLKQQKEELLNQLQFKDRAIAILAHDLRNPLTAASLAIGTLELTQNLPGDKTLQISPTLVNQLIQQARNQLRAIDKLITDILQAAIGSSTNLHIQPQKLDIAILVNDVINQMQERILEKSLKINTDIPQDLPYVYVDEERVRQVMMNLIDNAIKYTPAGGKIVITIFHRTTEKVQVIVCDNGPGIPEGNLEKIFEDHFRLQRDIEQEGYGLGLSLCRRIVQAHYGKIWVDSNLGEGSSFNFTLPVYRF